MNALIAIAILTYTFVVGIRYSEGDDFQAYLYYYQMMLVGKEYDMYFEVGFKYLCRIISFFSAPSYILFSILAFFNILSIYLFYKRNSYYFLLPYGIFFFFCSDMGFSLSLNILRQFTAFFIIILSFEFLFKRKLILYVALILVASLFHKSAVICIIFYFMKKDIITFKNRYQIIFLLSFTFIVGQYIVPSFYNIITYVAYFAGFVDYSQSTDIQSFEIQTGSGIGLFTRFICSCFIVFYSPNIKQYFKNYNYIFNIFLFGVFFKTFFCTNLLLLRSLVYPMGIEFILLSMMSYYLFKIKKTTTNLLIGTIVISLNIIMFYLSILNNSNMISPYTINPDL